MPCRSEYQEPNQREIETNRVANLLVYVTAVKDVDISGDLNRRIVSAADNSYPNISDLDEFVATLCKILGSLTEQELNDIVYNGRSARARRLADWWDNHQKVDAERIAEEKRKEELRQVYNGLMDYLSEKEKAALRLYFRD